jgi:hypothetical protein
MADVHARHSVEAKTKPARRTSQDEPHLKGREGKQTDDDKFILAVKLHTF